MSNRITFASYDKPVKDGEVIMRSLELVCKEYEPSEFLESLRHVLDDGNWFIDPDTQYLTHKPSGIAIWMNGPIRPMIMLPEKFQFDNHDWAYIGHALESAYYGLLGKQKNESGERMLKLLNKS